MSNNIQVLNTGQQATTNYDIGKIFVWENRYERAPYNNSDYGSVTLAVGTVMGRVTSTGYIKPLDSTASDGSQVPAGILAADVQVAGGATVDLPMCIYGDVVEDRIVFANANDNMDTTVTSGGYSRRMRDRIQGDTAGIRIVPNTELTGYDNQ